MVRAENPNLSASAYRFIEDAASAGHSIVISPISLAEIVYLIEKGRFAESVYDELRKALADPDCVVEEAPFNAEIVASMRMVARADVPDMPDRIVAATAVYFGVPVISRDGRIRASTVQRCGERSLLRGGVGFDESSDGRLQRAPKD